MCFWCLHIGFSQPGNQLYYKYVTESLEKNKCVVFLAQNQDMRLFSDQNPYFTGLFVTFVKMSC